MLRSVVDKSVVVSDEIIVEAELPSDVDSVVIGVRLLLSKEVVDSKESEEVSEVSEVSAVTEVAESVVVSKLVLELVSNSVDAEVSDVVVSNESVVLSSSIVDVETESVVVSNEVDEVSVELDMSV